MPTLETLAAGDGHAHFAWGALLIHVWWADMTYESVALAGKLGREMAKRNPGGIGSISIGAGGLKLPSREAQKEGSRSMQESQAWLLCNGVVIEGEGFWASAARGCYSAMQYVVRHKSPQKTFRTASEAVFWACSHVPGLSGTEKLLIDALEYERAKLQG